MEKEKLKKYLENGFSTRKIGKIEGCDNTTVSYYVKKYGLRKISAFSVDYRKDVDQKFFNKIDTKEKAYIVGFLLGDGYISKNNDVVLGLQISDDKIIKDIEEKLPWKGNISYDYYMDKKSRHFPNVSLGFHSRGMGKSLIKHFGGRLKTERHYPIINKKLEPYLIAGFFDADGSVSFGKRKDRDRIWHKVNFTSPFNILTGVQKYLLKHDISTAVRPKSNENVYVLEFASKNNLRLFFDILPSDGLRLQRKVEKFEKLNTLLKK